MNKKLSFFFELFSSSPYPSYSFSPMIEVHSRFIYSLFAQDILACLVCSSLRNIYVMLYSPCESKYFYRLKHYF